jgi:hypothetical protein
MSIKTVLPRPGILVAWVAALVSGCATPIKPDALATPPEITCIELTEPLSWLGHYGTFNADWQTRLEKGAYVSERVDDHGTYYRAPAGGVSTTRPEEHVVPKPSIWDGGFYVPTDAKEPIRIYRYFSTENASTDTQGEAATCATLAYIKDPSGKKLDVVALSAAGAAGGAVGGVAGRSLAKGSTMSYGHAAGVGAAGGLLGGFVIVSIINSDVGKIIPWLPIQDPAFMDKLRDLAAHTVILSEVQTREDAAPRSVK